MCSLNTEYLYTSVFSRRICSDPYDDNLLVIAVLPLMTGAVVYLKGISSWDLGTQIVFAILIPQAFGATI